MVDIDGIKKILPHRYPFLLVDRIIEKGENKAIGIKNVTVNEPFFEGHYPQKPIMPGVLICEAMAQVSGVALSGALDYDDVLPLFAGIDRLRFKKIVVPGDQLVIESEIIRFRKGLAKVSATARVDGEVACQGELMFMLRRAEELN